MARPEKDSSPPSGGSEQLAQFLVNALAGAECLGNLLAQNLLESPAEPEHPALHCVDGGVELYGERFITRVGSFAGDGCLQRPEFFFTARRLRFSGKPRLS